MWQRNRRLAGLAILVAAAVLPAKAADKALAHVVGYSQDGRYFAFEEFGIQDGSGFAYSNYFMIDLTQDRWVVGTPVRQVAESEDVLLAAVREAAAAEAAPRLDDLGIEVPAQYVAGYGDGALDTDGHSISFGLPMFSGPGSVSGHYSLELAEFDADAASPCFNWFGASARGFLARFDENEVIREVHRDGVLPRSRGCPETYRIYGIYAPFEAGDLSAGVALISIYAHGFEGLDRRFMALPLGAYGPGS